MNRFLTENSPAMRLARTIVQAVVGVLISYADVLIGQAAISPELRPMIVALVMAVLAPLMAVIGENDDKKEPVTEGDEVGIYESQHPDETGGVEIFPGFIDNLSGLAEEEDE